MREKKKTLDKNNDNLKLKKIAKKQKLQEQGITLVALVVTIIILLILAGVTLNIALSDNGLFSKAKKAAEEYDQAQSEEEDLISQFATQMYSEYVGATVEGYEPTSDSGECTVESVTTEGEAQTIKRDTNMSWRVWDFDGNTLRIIGDPTTDTLKLQGAAGYNNGVWALDHICKELYSNDKPGVTVTSLKRTDIQKVSTYDYTKYKHKPDENVDDTSNGDDSSIYFGATKTYETNNQYPKMWNENDKDWTYEYDNENKTTTGRDKECKIWEVIGTSDGQMDDNINKGDKNTTFKQSFYYHFYDNNEFINDKYYDLMFKKADGTISRTYWIADRLVHLRSDECWFSIGCVRYSYEQWAIVSENTCTSSGDVNGKPYAIRPVVSIDLKTSGCELTRRVDETGNVTVTLHFRE